MSRELLLWLMCLWLRLEKGSQSASYFSGLFRSSLDCGVFLMAYMFSLVSGQTISIDQKDCARHRARIVALFLSEDSPCLRVDIDFIGIVPFRSIARERFPRPLLQRHPLSGSSSLWAVSLLMLLPVVVGRSSLRFPSGRLLVRFLSLIKIVPMNPAV
ncbi:uncharacterized protein LOC109846544 [Asparagus officinalis]|uniref:uncharacterized protein LOC109846544 n=1 Tax=Asparagus officinalis TaxID=4686 RepID=UPI00098DEEC1|nr:uncharacterized protein LOC109846544 [Asparagus officinalis]XP_020271379.1 uncharacterized protein LOC109846544 [Asparagus officinalis]